MRRTLVCLCLLLVGCDRSSPEGTTAPEPAKAETPSAIGPVADPPRLWLGMEAGPYGVGYRQQLIFDPARRYENPLVPLPQRPVLASIWYPARPGGTAMSVLDYTRVPTPDDADGARLAELLEGFNLEVLIDEGLARPRAFRTPTQKAELDAILSEPVHARRDAPAMPEEQVRGVVLNHPGLGGAFADNFVLHELLASRGYVVVSTPVPSAYTTSFGAGWDPATSIADLDLVVGVVEASGLLGPDTPVATMGHSYGAQVALIYAMQRRRVDAIVSLDSTIENADPAAPFYEQAGSKRWFDAGEVITVPLLVLTSESGTNTEYVESLHGADRRIVAIETPDHNDFVTHGGVLRSLFAHESRGDEAAGAESFTAAYRKEVELVLAFLEGTLGGDAEELARLDGAEGVRHLTPGGGGAVDFTHLSELLGAGGLDAVVEFCAPPDGEPKCPSEYVLRELAWSQVIAGDRTRGIALLRHVVERYPDSAGAHDRIGEALLRAGDAAEALRYLRRAAELAPEHERPQYEMRARWAAEVVEAQSEAAP